MEEPIPPQSQDQKVPERKEALEEPIPPQPQEQGATGSNNMTPKRKLSPTPLTPMGIPRKITTQMHGSPLLRGTFETFKMELDWDQTQEQSNPVEGIENLNIGDVDENKQLATLEQNDNLFQTPRVVKRPKFRLRTTSMTNNTGLQRRSRRPRNLSERDASSPIRQLRITDIFKSQQVQESVPDSVE